MRKEFSTLDIVKALGITRERLRDWINQSFITAKIAAEGHGTKAIFTVNDVYGIAFFRFLVESGFNRSAAAKWTKEFTKELYESPGYRDKAIIKFIVTKDNLESRLGFYGNDVVKVMNKKMVMDGIFDREGNKINLEELFPFHPELVYPEDLHEKWQMVWFVNLRQIFNEVDEALAEL